MPYGVDLPDSKWPPNFDARHAGITTCTPPELDSRKAEPRLHRRSCRERGVASRVLTRVAYGRSTHLGRIEHHVHKLQAAAYRRVVGCE